MIVSLAAATLLNAAAAQAPVTPDQLPSIFISACLDGSIRLPQGSAASIEYSALPDTLRRLLGTPSSGQAWRIKGSGADAYLYSLNYKERGSSPKICGVAAQNLVLRPASAAVETRLSGVQSAGSSKPIEWLNSEAGYNALATRAGGYTILQVNWLEDKKAEVPRTQ